MAEYYKFEIANWDEGTAMLTLEQEAAYLRVVNAIRLKDQPLTFNMFALCGIWRCNERKAKRLLGELVDAGKLRIEDGKIINDKAVEDASNLRRLRADRASAGSRGGIESGKVRAKSLENKEQRQAIASTREEKRREEYSVSKDTGADAPIDPEKVMFDGGIRLLTAVGKSSDQARSIIGKWKRDFSTPDVIAALGKAQREGAIDPVGFITKTLGETRRRERQQDPRNGDERVTPDGRRQIFIGTGWITKG